MTQAGRYTTQADGQIVSLYVHEGKLYALTATSKYIVRTPRKRWRDKNKPSMGQMRRVAYE